MAKPIENTERISTFVTSDILEKLKGKASSRGMTVSGYIRMLIIDAVGSDDESFPGIPFAIADMLVEEE
jgi:predicted DNA binding CopG/RHH family protein